MCLFSLVVPPGSMTPVHDHLAWGLVGLYKGNQDEESCRTPGRGALQSRPRRTRRLQSTRPPPLLPRELGGLRDVEIAADFLAEFFLDKMHGR